MMFTAEKPKKRNGYWRIVFGYVTVTHADDEAHANRITAALNGDPGALHLGRLLDEVADGTELRLWKGAALWIIRTKSHPEDVTDPMIAANLLWEKVRDVKVHPS